MLEWAASTWPGSDRLKPVRGLASAWRHGSFCRPSANDPGPWGDDQCGHARGDALWTRRIGRTIKDPFSLSFKKGMVPPG